MILLEDFVNLTLEQIYKGVSSFNKRHKDLKAFPPEMIDFQINTVLKKDGLYVCDKVKTKEIGQSNLKFQVSTNRYYAKKQIDYVIMPQSK